MSVFTAGRRAPQVVVVRGFAGVERAAYLTHLVEEAAQQGQPAWLVACDGRRGVWSGLNTWLEALLPELREHAPDLLQRHDQELTTILPSLRRTLPNSRLSLTDLASRHERVRNYAQDRAHRFGHGVIDLLLAWRARAGNAPWRLVCDDYDEASALVRVFVRELLRRAGAELKLELCVAVAPSCPAGLLDELPQDARCALVELDGAPAPERSVDAACAAREAEALDQATRGNQLEMELALPRLIQLWTLVGNVERATYWHALAMGLLNHYGFYEDARRHLPVVRANIDLLVRHDAMFTRWSLVGSMLSCLIALGQAEEALALVHAEALGRCDEPRDKARVLYVLAMLHARFLPTKNLPLAEHYIAAALDEVTPEGIGEANERDFLRVFLTNGLAFIRHRQGRSAEAIELCDGGFKHLQVALPAEHHRLHRSVLMYNIAQVHASTGAPEKALVAFDAAIEMDPNYSEYHNERACVLMNMGRHAAALAAFDVAIRTSAPYAEVWANLGQCQRQLNDLRAAVTAFDRALDLNPRLLLARIARADCHDQLGHGKLARADYDVALEVDPNHVAARVNRGILRFEAGDVAGAIADLDVAIAGNPRQPELYRNRAAAYRAQGRLELAERDLEVSRHLVRQPSAVAAP
jgi:tetratricopeptide (TPR) repeat protein